MLDPPRTGVTDDRDPSYVYMKSNPGPLEESPLQTPPKCIYITTQILTPFLQLIGGKVKLALGFWNLLDSGTYWIQNMDLQCGYVAT